MRSNVSSGLTYSNIVNKTMIIKMRSNSSINNKSYNLDNEKQTY